MEEIQKQNHRTFQTDHRTKSRPTNVELKHNKQITEQKTQSIPIQPQNPVVKELKGFLSSGHDRQGSIEKW